MSLDVERNMYDEDKNYAYGVTQQGRDYVPADENDSKESLFRFVSSIAVALNMEGFIGDAYKITPPAAEIEHDFYVTEGTGFTNGLRAFQGASVSWLLPDYASEVQKSLHSVVSQVGSTGIQDYGMSWVTDELIGKKIRVQKKSDSTILIYTITSNLETFIGVSGDPAADGVEPGCSYCIVPEDVTVDRTDLVCLNMWVGDADYREDPDLLHPLIASREAMARRKMRSVITVITDVDAVDPVSDTPANYVDSLGESHYFMYLGSFARTAGDNVIELADIADHRVGLKNLDTFLMLDCSNDPLTGVLNLSNRLVMGENISMGVNNITGDNATLNFGTGAMTFVELNVSSVNTTTIGGEYALFEHVYTDEIRLPETGTSPYITIAPRSGYEGELDVTTVDGVNRNLTQIRAGFPRENDHLATKKYVDYADQNHRHSRYVEKDSLQAMQAILSPDDISVLLTAKFSSPSFPGLVVGEYVEWTHGLGTEYILTQVRYRGSAAVPWEEDSAVLKYFVVDRNTLRIANFSGGAISGANVMAVAFSVPMIVSISVVDAMAMDAFGDGAGMV